MCRQAYCGVTSAAVLKTLTTRARRRRRFAPGVADMVSGAGLRGNQHNRGRLEFQSPPPPPSYRLCAWRFCPFLACGEVGYARRIEAAVFGGGECGKRSVLVVIFWGSPTPPARKLGSAPVSGARLVIFSEAPVCAE